jgi:hypothetical protein
VTTPITVLDNAPYRVVMSVRGTRFTTWVEGQQVDSWTDDHITSGGVGFFGDPGERARLYWVKVSNNDDLVGRACAFFFGQRPNPYFERGRPNFCGDESSRSLVSYDQTPATGDRACSL